MRVSNVFDEIPGEIPTELVQTLASARGVRIERIVSAGHASPDGFWYDQDQAEWVIVLKGRASLAFDGRSEPISLGPGDHFLIPAHQKHRVEWTTEDEPTIWLAVFYDEDRLNDEDPVP